MLHIDTVCMTFNNHKSVLSQTKTNIEIPRCENLALPNGATVVPAPPSPAKKQYMEVQHSLFCFFGGGTGKGGGSL